jgi:hypothetical protein
MASCSTNTKIPTLETLWFTRKPFNQQGSKDLLYSVQILPGDDVVTIVGEIQLSSDPDDTGYPETVSLFKESTTTTEPQEIAAEVRRLAVEVCSQRDWRKALENDD